MIREFLSKPDGAHRVMIDMATVEAVMEQGNFTTIVTGSDTYNVIQNYETVKLAWEAHVRASSKRKDKK